MDIHNCSVVTNGYTQLLMYYYMTGGASHDARATVRAETLYLKSGRRENTTMESDDGSTASNVAAI